MNKYSAALRHINIKDVKQKHQQKLIECENKLKDEIEEKKYIQSVMETKRYNWRDEIKTIDEKIEDVIENVNNKQYNWREELQKDKKKYFVEGMTTSNFYNNGQQGETDISTSVDAPAEFTSDLIPGYGFTELRYTEIPVDYSNHDSIVIDISGGGGAPYWGDWETYYGGIFTPEVYAFFYALDDGGNLIGLNGDFQGGSPRNSPPFGTLSTIDTLLNYGSNTLTIPSELRQGNLYLYVYQNANLEPNIVGGVTPPTTINSVTLRGKTPINVFVPLDSPEAVSFVRTGSGDLSPEEKRKRLKKMLEASDEYVMKMLGLDFPGTGAVAPGEYDPFKQAPPGEAGDTPGVEIANRYQPRGGDFGPSLKPDGTTGFPKPGEMNKGDDGWYEYLPGGGWQKIPSMGVKTAQASQDTQIAQIQPAQQRRGATGVGVPDTTGTSPGSNPPPSSQMNYPKEWLPKQAQRTRMPMVASYEPRGQLISEKKKLKSPQEILNKIPGYYDGKPSPLGFPVEPPPKMVNGMHPDLVDGKKVADRFNRLDPESAKAMPPTGNPHIDKKVRAAAKKPK